MSLGITEIRLEEYVRVLDCFVLALNGKAVSIDELRIASQDWNGLTAVGAVASLVGPGSLFAQCGWLHRVPWLWLVLPKVDEIVIKADSRFWGGCVLIPASFVWIRALPCVTWQLLEHSVSLHTRYSPHSCLVFWSPSL